MPDQILVVDDEEDIREIYVRALEKEGFLVDAASEAEGALKLLSTKRYQVVVADIRMPGMDGIALLGKIRELAPGTDVIMATGYPATSSAIQALRLGAFDYIVKPFSLDELIHTVQKAIRAQKLSAENLLLKRINAIYEVSSAFSTTMGLKALLELILEKGVSGVGGQSGSIYLSRGEELVKEAEWGEEREDFGFVKEVVAQGEKVVVQQEKRAIIGIPLHSRGGREGVLCIEREGERFSEEEQRLLQLFAEQAALAIRDARVNEELQQKVVELKQAYDKLKQAQEQLLRTEKLSALGELAAGVAHEINNPLATLLGYVQVLSRKGDWTEKEERYLQVMEQEIERMAKIVTSLLNFAHQEAPKRELCSLKPLLEETILITEHQIYRYGPIEIITQVDNHLPEISVDRSQFQQVLVNLMLNAAQAMEEKGGKLWLRMKASSLEERPAVLIEVEDTGSGIPRDILPKIFDPFFTTKETGRGTGLGLSIAYGIVESHGGTIKVESQEGKGTKFSILLPGGLS